MASLSVFQPFIDKENTTANGISTKTPRGQVRGLGGKVFENGTPLSMSRKALSDVNKGMTPSHHDGCKAQKQKLQPPSQQLFKKPALKLRDSQSGNRADKPLGERKQKSIITPFVDQPVQTVTKQPDPAPPKEAMHVYNEEDDLDNRYPSKHLNLTDVVSKIRQWRPTCIYGIHPDSDGEEELSDRETSDIDLVVDAIELPLSDYTPADVPEDIFPDLDLDLHMPFLDDTLDIEANLGTLEVHTSSTPLELSPLKPDTSS